MTSFPLIEAKASSKAISTLPLTGRQFSRLHVQFTAEILLELGIPDVSEGMRNALKALVMDDVDLRTEHQLPSERVPRVDLKAMLV